tara:strand:- start:572 stop:958 length:387 start_codon:yes stop_codon:yes gene_type:complete
MASTVVRTTLRLDQLRNAALFANTETAVGGSETTVLDKFDCALFNRYAIQIFNSDGSVVGVAKVYGSLVDVPNASIPTSDWTQIGDDITVGTSSSALKAISTTPIRHLAVTATGNGADLTVYIYAEQV